jgi:hypothetical protein
MFDHKIFDYFIQIRPTSGTVSFRNYTDIEGNTLSAFQTLGQTFNDHKPFWITFSVRERTYRAPKGRDIFVSINGDHPVKMKLADYLKNSPWTEGSKNLKGDATIKMFDEVKDAKTGVDRRKQRLEAGNIALNLSNDQLTQMAQLIGVFSDDKTVQLNRVLEFADQEPEAFLEFYNGADREAKALIKKGLKTGVLKEKGKMIMWDKEMIGADESEAISSLMKNEQLFKAVSTAVKKLK